MRGCAHCHTLELVTRSKHNAESMTKVVERMAGYPPLAFPLMPQRTPAPRVGAGTVSREQQLQTWRRQAEYLSTLNLGTGTGWNYALKTFPLPSGAATRGDLHRERPARRTRQPDDDRRSVGHGLVRGVGEQIIGKMDATTGKVTHDMVPTLKPAAPKGIWACGSTRTRTCGWDAVRGGIVKSTRRRRVRGLEPAAASNGDHVQTNQVGPGRDKVDGKVWSQDVGTCHRARREDGRVEVLAPYPIPRPTCTTRARRTTTGGICRSRRGVGRDRREDRRHHDVQDADDRSRSTARHDGRRRARGSVRTAATASGCSNEDRQFKESHPDQGWPYDVTADRTDRVVGQRRQRPHRPVEPVTGQMIEDRRPARPMSGA